MNISYQDSVMMQARIQGSFFASSSLFHSYIFIYLSVSATQSLGAGRVIISVQFRITFLFVSNMSTCIKMGVIQ